jgi:hypothetical protein
LVTVGKCGKRGKRETWKPIFKIDLEHFVKNNKNILFLSKKGWSAQIRGEKNRFS